MEKGKESHKRKKLMATTNKTTSSVKDKIRGLTAIELIYGVSVAAIEASHENNEQLVTRKEATIGLSADAPLPTQTGSPLPEVPVSTTESVGIISIRRTMGIDTEMSTNTSNSSYNIFNSYLLSYKEPPHLPSCVVPKSQK